MAKAKANKQPPKKTPGKKKPSKGGAAAVLVEARTNKQPPKRTPAKKQLANKKPRGGGAAAVLFKAVGKPDNINTVEVEGKPCVKRWLALGEVERAATVAELATALDAMRKRGSWEDIRSSAWNSKYEFTQMVALGKAIDRLVRARLPLDEATLVKLARTVVDRDDFSVRHLTAQLEHYGKTQVVGPELRAAMVGMTKRFSWRDYDAMRARLAWLISPAQAERIGTGRAA